VTIEWSLPWNGGCRCAKLRIRATAAPILTMACHCKGCQRMSASAYSLSAMFLSNGFMVSEGEPVIGGIHREHRRYFCAHCKSWLFTRPHGVDQFINVRPTMFDDVSWFSPFIETYTSEKLSWAITSARHSFERLPAMTANVCLVAMESKL
jgi:hypothetical protein